MVFLDHWPDPVQEAGIQDDEHTEQVATHKQEMHKFVHMTPFNRVVRGSSEVPPIDDDHPIIDHPIIPDIPVDNTKDDGDGGGVLPLAVGGGAALILLLVVK